jgi:hypothetical protein
MKQLFYHKNALIGFAVILLLMTGCKSNPNGEIETYGNDRLLQNAMLVTAATPFYLVGIRTPEGPSVLETGTEEEIRRLALTTARADIAAGKPRIAFTGGFASMAVGVPREHLALVEKLPRVPLPTGCTTSLLNQATIYAEAYNKEILPYIISEHELHK